MFTLFPFVNVTLIFNISCNFPSICLGKLRRKDEWIVIDASFLSAPLTKTCTVCGPRDVFHKWARLSCESELFYIDSSPPLENDSLVYPNFGFP